MSQSVVITACPLHTHTCLIKLQVFHGYRAHIVLKEDRKIHRASQIPQLPAQHEPLPAGPPTLMRQVTTTVRQATTAGGAAVEQAWSSNRDSFQQAATHPARNQALHLLCTLAMSEFAECLACVVAIAMMNVLYFGPAFHYNNFVGALSKNHPVCIYRAMAYSCLDLAMEASGEHPPLIGGL